MSGDNAEQTCGKCDQNVSKKLGCFENRNQKKQNVFKK